MKLDEFKEKLFKKAHLEGFSEYEIYYVNNSTLSIRAFEKELEKYAVSNTNGLSFRGIFNGNMGYAYTEVLDDTSLELLIKNAKENALVIETMEKEIIYKEKGNYASFDGYKAELSNVSPKEKIDLALLMEEETRKQSDKVLRSECTLEDGESYCRIINSHGLDVSFKSNDIIALIESVVQDGAMMNSSFAIKCSKNFNEINAPSLAKEAIDEALAYVGAASIESGKYRIALRNDVSGSLLRTFSGIFSSDNVQKGLSLLKGKLGEKIASSKVTIIDNPLLDEGLNSRPFDAEGVATYTKNVIENGELKTLLYNLKTAEKDCLKSTGNASKNTYSSPISIAPSNFYFEPGKKDFKGILEALGEGLLITDVQGLHSGANPISGDFSLAAKGFLIKDGAIKRPVEQITVSGNFYVLLKNIEEVGSDLKFTYPSGDGYFGSPTILVTEMSISGK
jgi:PmbA protein